ncbi:MAG: hypothetical protein U0Y82_06100 [Thermoleophilia bacterium]
MVWILVLILVVAIFGLGSVLKVAFWTLLIPAVVVVGLGALAHRAMR